MKLANELTATRHAVPCMSIQKFLYTYSEYETVQVTDWFANETESVFYILLEFPDNTYMEIQHVQDYGIQSAVGDIGGYIGMFLGLGFLQGLQIITKGFSALRQYLLGGSEDAAK